MRELRSEERWELTHFIRGLKEGNHHAKDLIIEVLDAVLAEDFYNRFVFLDEKKDENE